MFFCVYKIINLVNYKIYIGKTDNASNRWAVHLRTATGGKIKYPGFSYIHNAINKYGADNFIFVIIDQKETDEEIKNAEKFWIQYYKSNNPKYGYNLTEGGEGTSGYKHTEEIKDFLKKINKGSNNPMYGKTGSNKGKKFSEKTKNKISNSKKGRKLSVETRKKMSLAHKGSERTEQAKQNMSQAQIKIAHIHSENNKGSKNKNAILNEQQVYEIRVKYLTGEYSYNSLSKEYKISKSMIANIVKYKSWKHI